MTTLSAALLLASTAAGMAANGAQPLVPVPSGAEVWLQEEMADRVPGVGLVQRYRFVMPSLAALVPLAACGKRGGPVPPGPANEITYPRVYPTY